jgi:putative lipoprotein
MVATMMRRLPLLAGFVALMSLASPAMATEPDPDPWFAKDKALHLGVSAGISSAAYVGAVSLFDARGHAMLAAGGLSLTVGAGKELADLAGLGDPSWKDFAADVVGTLLGVGLAWAIDLAVRGVNARHPLLSEPSGLATMDALH